MSGLSQGRKIPDRRMLEERGRKSNKPSPKRQAPQNIQKSAKIRTEKFKTEVKKIILIQAFARGYIQRFAYQSQLTMERTKKNFFATEIQGFFRGFLQRQRYQKTFGKTRPTRSTPEKPMLARDLSPMSLGSPKPVQVDRKPKSIKPKPMPHLKVESDSDRSEVSYRMQRLPAHRRDKVKTYDAMGDSESDVGSIISNLSQARNVPDRRRKHEDREKKVVKIQALARGYIRRFLYKSMLAMAQTKKKYAAITIQAHSRGYLQRKNGPELSRKHVAPRREPIPDNKKKTVGDDDCGSRRRKKKKTKKPIRNNNKSTAKNKEIHKPPKRKGGADERDAMLPKELTIRKPRRHRSDSDQESDVPMRQLTIRQPRRYTSDSDDNGNAPSRRVTTTRTEQSTGRNGTKKNNSNSPPRKLTLQMKKPTRHESDSDRSEESLQPEKSALDRRERFMSLGGASDARFGESESEAGSLMSGLSKARRVPDRRRKDDSVVKIQAVARRYIQRFAFKSLLTMEQTKRKFFAIQLQALARGWLARSKLSNGSQFKKAKDAKRSDSKRRGKKG